MQRRAAHLPCPPLGAQGLLGLLWGLQGGLLCFRGRLPFLEKMLEIASLGSEAVLANCTLVSVGFAGGAGFVEFCVGEFARSTTFAVVEVVKVPARFQI